MAQNTPVFFLVALDAPHTIMAFDNNTKVKLVLNSPIVGQAQDVFDFDPNADQTQLAQRGTIKFRTEFENHIEWGQCAQVATLKVRHNQNDTQDARLDRSTLWLAVTKLGNNTLKAFNTHPNSAVLVDGVNVGVWKPTEAAPLPETEARGGWTNFIRKLLSLITALEKQDFVDNKKIHAAFASIAGHIFLHHFGRIGNLAHPVNKFQIGTKGEIPEVSCLTYLQGNQKKNPEEELKVNNWGQTNSIQAGAVFVPTSKKDITQIVIAASRNSKSIRCTGYTHTWAEMYIDNDAYSIAFIPPKATYAETVINNVHEFEDVKDEPRGELHQIFWDDVKTIKENGEEFGLLRAGPGARNVDFLRGCKQRRFAWTIPFNVIMTEITFGGSTSMICHGAGITSTTLSDLVYAIQIIDFNGQLKTFNREKDGAFMDSIAGGFGLFGVIVEITFKLPKMSIAKYSPYKINVNDAIPPPGVENPTALTRLENDMKKYYAEWFWYPYQDNVWVNCYENHTVTTIPPSLYDVSIMNNSDKYFSTVTSYGAVLAQAMKPDCAKCAQLMGNIAYNSMPSFQQSFPTADYPLKNQPQETKDVILIEAVHFRRGIHSMQVRDMEAEITMPDAINGDDTIATNMLRKLWWAGIELSKKYKEQKKAPLTMALEMRLTGSATATMAAQRGNNRTASIEVLSIKGVAPDSWKKYCLELWTKWNEITKEAQDQYNNHPSIAGTQNQIICKIRPHWAKEWGFLMELDQNPLNLREMYKEEIKQFRQHLNRYAQDGGDQQVTDYLKLFGNEALRRIFQGEPGDLDEEPEQVVQEEDNQQEHEQVAEEQLNQLEEPRQIAEQEHEQGKSDQVVQEENQEQVEPAEQTSNESNMD